VHFREVGVLGKFYLFGKV